MDVWDFWIGVETEWEWNFGWFLWESDTARSQPKQSVSLFCCFTAFQHKCEEAFFLLAWELVFGYMDCRSRTVVIAVSFDVPPCAHLNISIQDWSVLRKLFAESIFPWFAHSYCKRFVLCGFFLIFLLPFSLLRFFLLPPFLSPSYPALACLNFLSAAGLVEFSTFLKLAGRFIW